MSVSFSDIWLDGDDDGALDISLAGLQSSNPNIDISWFQVVPYTNSPNVTTVYLAIIPDYMNNLQNAINSFNGNFNIVFTFQAQDGNGLQTSANITVNFVGNGSIVTNQDPTLVSYDITALEVNGLDAADIQILGQDEPLLTIRYSDPLNDNDENTVLSFTLTDIQSQNYDTINPEWFEVVTRLDTSNPEITIAEILIRPQYINQLIASVNSLSALEDFTFTIRIDDGASSVYQNINITFGQPTGQPVIEFLANYSNDNIFENQLAFNSPFSVYSVSDNQPILQSFGSNLTNLYLNGELAPLITGFSSGFSLSWSQGDFSFNISPVGDGTVLVIFNLSQGAIDRIQQELQAGQIGTIAFPVRYTDADGHTITSSHIISITGVNQAPVINFVSSAYNETDSNGDGNYEATVIKSDLPSTEPVARFTISDDSQITENNISLSISGGIPLSANHYSIQQATYINGNIDYQIFLTGDGVLYIQSLLNSPNQSAQIIFELRVEDEEFSVSRTFTLTITGENQAPDVTYDSSIGSVNENTLNTNLPVITFNVSDDQEITVGNLYNQNINTSISLVIAGNPNSPIALINYTHYILEIPDSANNSQQQVRFFLTQDGIDLIQDSLQFGQTGVISFTVGYTDAYGASDSLTRVITIIGGNEAPVITFDSSDYNEQLSANGIYSATVNENNLQANQVIARFSVTDDQMLDTSNPNTFQLTTDIDGVTNLILGTHYLAQPQQDINGNIFYIISLTQAGVNYLRSELTEGESAEISFNLTVTDAGGLTATTNFIYIINGVNQAPVINFVWSGYNEIPISDIAHAANINETQLVAPTLIAHFRISDDVPLDLSSLSLTVDINDQGQNLSLIFGDHYTILSGHVANSSDLYYTITLNQAGVDYLRQQLTLGESASIKFTLTAGDEGGLTATREFILNVTGVADDNPPVNQAPTYDSWSLNGGNGYGTVIEANEIPNIQGPNSYLFDITFIDPSGDGDNDIPLTFEIVSINTGNSGVVLNPAWFEFREHSLFDDNSTVSKLFLKDQFVQAFKDAINSYDGAFSATFQIRASDGMLWSSTNGFVQINFNGIITPPTSQIIVDLDAAFYGFDGGDSYHDDFEEGEDEGVLANDDPALQIPYDVQSGPITLGLFTITGLTNPNSQLLVNLIITDANGNAVTILSNNTGGINLSNYHINASTYNIAITSNGANQLNNLLLDGRYTAKLEISLANNPADILEEMNFHINFSDTPTGDVNNAPEVHGSSTFVVTEATIEHNLNNNSSEQRIATITFSDIDILDATPDSLAASFQILVGGQAIQLEQDDLNITIGYSPDAPQYATVELYLKNLPEFLAKVQALVGNQPVTIRVTVTDNFGATAHKDLVITFQGSASPTTNIPVIQNNVTLVDDEDDIDNDPTSGQLQSGSYSDMNHSTAGEGTLAFQLPITTPQGFPLTGLTINSITITQFDGNSAGALITIQAGHPFYPTINTTNGLLTFNPQAFQALNLGDRVEIQVSYIAFNSAGQAEGSTKIVILGNDEAPPVLNPSIDLNDAHYGYVGVDDNDNAIVVNDDPALRITTTQQYQAISLGQFRIIDVSDPIANIQVKNPSGVVIATLSTSSGHITISPVTGVSNMYNITLIEQGFLALRDLGLEGLFRAELVISSQSNPLISDLMKFEIDLEDTSDYNFDPLYLTVRYNDNTINSNDLGVNNPFAEATFKDLDIPSGDSLSFFIELLNTSITLNNGQVITLTADYFDLIPLQNVNVTQSVNIRFNPDRIAELQSYLQNLAGNQVISFNVYAVDEAGNVSQSPALINFSLIANSSTNNVAIELFDAFFGNQGAEPNTAGYDNDNIDESALRVDAMPSGQMISLGNFAIFGVSIIGAGNYLTSLFSVNLTLTNSSGQVLNQTFSNAGSNPEVVIQFVGNGLFNVALTSYGANKLRDAHNDGELLTGRVTVTSVSNPSSSAFMLFEIADGNTSTTGGGTTNTSSSILLSDALYGNVLNETNTDGYDNDNIDEAPLRIDSLNPSQPINLGVFSIAGISNVISSISLNLMVFGSNGLALNQSFTNSGANPELSITSLGGDLYNVTLTQAGIVKLINIVPDGQTLSSTLRVSNGATNYANMRFEIVGEPVVVDNNTPPSISGISNITINEDNLSAGVIATMQIGDAQTPNYMLATNVSIVNNGSIINNLLPNIDYFLNHNGGTLTLNLTQAGVNKISSTLNLGTTDTIQFAVTVTDQGGLQATHNIFLEVIGSGGAPVVQGPSVMSVFENSLSEGVMANFNVVGEASQNFSFNVQSTMSTLSDGSTPQGMVYGMHYNIVTFGNTMQLVLTQAGASYLAQQYNYLDNYQTAQVQFEVEVVGQNGLSSIVQFNYEIVGQDENLAPIVTNFASNILTIQESALSSSAPIFPLFITDDSNLSGITLNLSDQINSANFSFFEGQHYNLVNMGQTSWAGQTGILVYVYLTQQAINLLQMLNNGEAETFSFNLLVTDATGATTNSNLTLNVLGQGESSSSGNISTPIQNPVGSNIVNIVDSPANNQTSNNIITLNSTNDDTSSQNSEPIRTCGTTIDDEYTTNDVAVTIDEDERPAPFLVKPVNSDVNPWIPPYQPTAEELIEQAIRLRAEAGNIGSENMNVLEEVAVTETETTPRGQEPAAYDTFSFGSVIQSNLDIEEGDYIVYSGDAYHLPREFIGEENLIVTFDENVIADIHTINDRNNGEDNL